ncbi:transposase [Streptomyces chattanoogensis]|uniref:transposase n=1 Tax=Streptomyces chattanoogensis TaxID=66876 RepID=UPI0036B388E4
MCGGPSTDAQWAVVEPLLPDRPPRRGGRWRDHRQAIHALAWKYQACGQERALRQSTGPGRAFTTGCTTGRSTSLGGKWPPRRQLRPSYRQGA